MPEEQSAIFWPWLIVLFVLTGGIIFIVSKKPHKKEVAEDSAK